MRLRGALAGRYGASAALMLAALVPNLLLTTATGLMQPAIAASLHASRTDLGIVEGLSNAAYAFGAVVAADLAQRLPQRRLMLVYESAFVIGTLVAATASAWPVFGAGRILEGLATGFMLIGALPPLITSYPARKLPVTAALVNVGLFGAITIGPLLGGVAAAPSAWRWLLAGLGAVGVAGLALAWTAIGDVEPAQPDLPIDAPVFPLALAGGALPLFGASWLTEKSFTSPFVWLPIVVGLGCLVTLIILEYRRRGEPLMPVRLIAHTLPVAGTLCAMVGGAVLVTLLGLIEVLLVEVRDLTPLHTGLLLWPQLGGMVVSATLFGFAFRTRYLALLPLSGMLMLLAAGAVLLTATSTDSELPVMLAALTLGLGAGATVSPGLFLAALAVPSNKVGRAFALVQLLRLEAGFIFAPHRPSLRHELRHHAGADRVRHPQCCRVGDPRHGCRRRHPHRPLRSRRRPTAAARPRAMACRRRTGRHLPEAWRAAQALTNKPRPRARARAARVASWLSAISPRPALWHPVLGARLLDGVVGSDGSGPERRARRAPRAEAIEFTEARPVALSGPNGKSDRGKGTSARRDCR